MELKQASLEDILAMTLCYANKDLSRYFDHRTHYTALDILNIDHAPPEDRLFVVLREFFFDRSTLFDMCSQMVQHHDELWNRVFGKPGVIVSVSVIKSCMDKIEQRPLPPKYFYLEALWRQYSQWTWETPFLVTFSLRKCARALSRDDGVQTSPLLEGRRQVQVLKEYIHERL